MRRRLIPYVITIGPYLISTASRVGFGDGWMWPIISVMKLKPGCTRDKTRHPMSSFTSYRPVMRIPLPGRPEFSIESMKGYCSCCQSFTCKDRT